jgi:inorganic pyrophosphatase
MIDSGELDWKIIAINVDDPLSSVLNSKEDVDKHLPGVISGMFTHILNSRYWIT